MSTEPVTKRKVISKRLEPYLFLAPVLIALLFMFAYPLLKGCVMAFQNYNLKHLDNVYFNGFENFSALFGDENLPMIAKNTGLFVLVCVTAQFTLGLILAVALWRPFRGRIFFQSIVFLPWAMSSFVVGLIFRWSFNGEYGVINELLANLGLITDNISWLGTNGLSLLVIVFATVWMGVPFFGIMILAALQSIPKDVFEAADIDGCGAIKKFKIITLPYIKPTIITTILLRSIWLFNSVEMIIIVTGGGPSYSSEILSSYLYTKAYTSLNFGQAAALGLLFIIGLLIFVVLYVKSTKYNKAGDF